MLSFDVMPTLQDKYSLFTPHFMLRKCSYEVDSSECTTNCIHKGRYCAVDSIDNKYSRKFQGWQVGSSCALAGSTEVQQRFDHDQYCSHPRCDIVLKTVTCSVLCWDECEQLGN